MTSLELLRLLLDVDRLAVAGALASRPASTDEIAAATGRHRRLVLTALGDLRAAGLVIVADDRYQIDAAALREAARQAADVEVPMDPIIGFGMTPDEQAILSRFFAGRTLTEIPTSRAKRQVVLQRLALEFEVGRRYTEREVNEILHVFHPDWSTLRRSLVDEGLLDRAHIDDDHMYWRSGGRLADPPSDGPPN